MLEATGVADVRIEPLPRPSTEVPADAGATSAVPGGDGIMTDAAHAATKFVVEFSYCLERVRWQVRYD